MKRERSSPLGFYTIGIAALFLAGFFLLVVFGAQSYRNTVTGQNENMSARSLLSYLATTARAYDTADGVAVTEGEDGPVLFFADGSTGYGLRIYRREGWLLEDYAAVGAPLLPEDAQRIGETERFDIEELGGGLLRVTTDAGRVLLYSRSEGGDAA